ncbi:hypothetical protein HUU59_08535 [bacterium]|nr:hypothetical protein [bacterium]
MKHRKRGQEACIDQDGMFRVTLPRAVYPANWRTANDQFQRRFLLAVLARHDWNKTCTARTLGIARRTLQLQMQALDIELD